MAPSKGGGLDVASATEGLVFSAGRISILAPACKSSRRTSLLPRATATWMGRRPLKSAVSIPFWEFLSLNKTLAAQ